MLSAEAGEDGRDSRDQLRECGSALGFRVPALDHHVVAEKKTEKMFHAQ